MSADAATTTTAAAPAANGNGAHAKEASDKKYNVDIAKMPGAHGKPDKAHHDAEMDRLKKEIDRVQAEVVSTQCECWTLAQREGRGQPTMYSPNPIILHLSLSCSLPSPYRTKCGAPSPAADLLPTLHRDNAGKSSVPSWTSYEVPRPG